MKKIFSIILVVALLATSLAIFSSCGKDEKEFVSVDATDLLQEDFGIAIKKGNDELKAEINKVIDKWLEDGTIEKYIDYYNALNDYVSGVEGATKPEAGDLKVTWDFGSATETITVYTESGFAPYEFVSEGKVVGLDMAIMSEVAVNMGKKMVVNDGSFDLIVENVKNATGLAVGAAGMTITDERKESVDFSNVYSSSTLVIVSSKDKSYSSVRDLAGLKVGVQEGTSGDLIISAAKGANGYVYQDDDGKDVTVKVDSSTDVKQYKQYALAFQDLKNGKIDAILMDKLPAQAMLKVVND